MWKNIFERMIFFLRTTSYTKRSTSKGEIEMDMSKLRISDNKNNPTLESIAQMYCATKKQGQNVVI